MSTSHRAKTLAKKLFEFIVNSRNNYNEDGIKFDKTHIIVNDLLRFFSNEDETLKAFSLFDKDGNMEISRREMKNTVLKIFRERRNVMSALFDTENALGRLDLILMVTASICVALAFLFGNAAKNLFDSILFVFVVHPYDTGDRVFIKLPENGMDPKFM
ncbi:hypothetical protein HK096_009978 [Nowakowskiella sp. JEL0078]|nr:hypothetical protein HK096_009978 [Nowakowskiella sp. JEL0078]